jgi:galactokinase
MQKDELEQLHATFDKHFGAGNMPRRSVAPGRVNLIGEHTDYNGGLVLPMAVHLHTTTLFRPNKSARISVYSEAIGARDEFDLKKIVKSDDPHLHWANYIRGVAFSLSKRGVKLKGGDLYIMADLPQGAGLSSSAALEISTGLALLSMAGKSMDRQELAYAGQEAEHNFAGVMSGIMDQTIVARAKAGHALLLDCTTMAVEYIPIAMEDYSFALFDTGVRHKLASSEYNKRRAECEHAAKIMGYKTLRSLTLDKFLTKYTKLTANEHKRLRHVATENLRVIQFAAALERGDIEELGKLLNFSHKSLSYDYQVSCKELDDIVERLAHNNRRDRSCPGARMVGGGFGGSVVALIKTSEFERYARDLAPLAKGGSRLLSSAGAATVMK